MQMGSGKRAAEINVTPMIDVLLVLLIIFMVIGPVKSRGFETRIPQPSAPDSQPPPPRHEIVIRVAENATIEVNSQAVSLDGLAAKLRPALRPGDVVFLQAANSLEFQVVAQVMDRAKEAGAVAIAFMPWH